MKNVDKVSKKLIDSLRSKGVNLDDSARTNVIIFAIAEAYGLGEEEGIIKGKKKAIEEMDRLKSQILRDIKLDEHLFKRK